MQIINQPPIGFIVEGHGEQITFPGIMSRICNIKNAFIPVVNARGFGGIINNLEEHLDDLVRVRHPFVIIITLDLQDVINDGEIDTCSELITYLNEKVQPWIEKRKENPIFLPFPVKIVTVIQIQKFESWWIADIYGLASITEFSIDPEKFSWDNVDIEIENPSKFLKEVCAKKVNLKSPSLAKKIFSVLNFDIIREKSRSFDKFCREIENAYNMWSRRISSIYENDQNTNY